MAKTIHHQCAYASICHTFPSTCARTRFYCGASAIGLSPAHRVQQVHLQLHLPGPPSSRLIEVGDTVPTHWPAELTCRCQMRIRSPRSSSRLAAIGYLQVAPAVIWCLRWRKASEFLDSKKLGSQEFLLTRYQRRIQIQLYRYRCSQLGWQPTGCYKMASWRRLAQLKMISLHQDVCGVESFFPV